MFTVIHFIDGREVTYQRETLDVAAALAHNICTYGGEALVKDEHGHARHSVTQDSRSEYWASLFQHDEE